MRVFLRGIKPYSYFGRLIAGRPDLDPHGEAFKKGLFADFERGLLADKAAWAAVSGNVAAHVAPKAGGGWELRGMNLYDPGPGDMAVMDAVWRAGSPYWLIPAQTYRAAVSRDLARRDGRMSRGVSVRALEDCAERIMRNVGVLLVNEDMMQGDSADGVCDMESMFPRLRSELARALGPKAAALGDRKVSDGVGFALWWYYMVSCSFVGPDDPQFPVAETDRPETWKKIEDMLNSLPPDPDEDQLLVFVNRFIDLCHGRGPLAGAFVEGGAATCAAVSGMSGDELYESAAR